MKFYVFAFVFFFAAAIFAVNAQTCLEFCPIGFHCECDSAGVCLCVPGKNKEEHRCLEETFGKAEHAKTCNSDKDCPAGKGCLPLLCCGDCNTKYCN